MHQVIQNVLTMFTEMKKRYINLKRECLSVSLSSHGTSCYSLGCRLTSKCDRLVSARKWYYSAPQFSPWENTNVAKILIMFYFCIIVLLLNYYSIITIVLLCIIKFEVDSSNWIFMSVWACLASYSWIVYVGGRRLVFVCNAIIDSFTLRFNHVLHNMVIKVSLAVWFHLRMTNRCQI